MDISSGLGVLPPNGAGAVSFVCAGGLNQHRFLENAKLEMPPTDGVDGPLTASSAKMVVVKDHQQREPSMGEITVLIWQRTFSRFMRSMRRAA